MNRLIKTLYHFFSAVFWMHRYGKPGKKLTVIGVTGTDGKTSSVHLIYEILRKAGKKVSMVSSVEAVINGKSYDTGFHVTTPTTDLLQKFMSMAVSENQEYFIVEVTSHGLDQFRLFGTYIDIALITNISHEHLDYHHNLENYRKAKAKILSKVKYAVLNADDENYKYLKEQVGTRAKIITFGLNNTSDYTPNKFSFETKLIGKYNQYNCLGAIAVAKTLNINSKTIKKAIFSFKGVYGRMEEIRNSKGYRIFIDFAHKPKALESVLQSAKSLTDKKIIIVFGCAGLRDKLKRPMMGFIAGKLADMCILTAEDPRTEDVRQIISEIAAGCQKAKAKEVAKGQEINGAIKEKGNYYWRIADRQEAINFSVRKLAKAGDIVILAGKGHEKSMCYGKIEYPWDERKAINKALYGNTKKTQSI